MKVATEIVQLGRPPSGPVNTPVYRASTIVFDTLDEFERAKDHERHALTYGRYGTPTTFSLEEAIARIEGAFAAALVPSGLSAITTALQAFLRPGDHLLLPDSVYGPARRFATQFLEPRGISASYYPAACGAGISQFLRPDTRVVYLESPGSLTFEMQDVPAICSVCKPRGIVTVADNTWATPLLFKPLAHGVDVSLQAGTKYLVGHSDAMIGTIAATQSCWNMIESTIVQLGLCVAPDEAYLAARGLRTMPVRLAQHARNAMAVASWLERQPQVARVCYPALESDPGHAIWQRDYRGASGLMGVFLKPLPQLQASADGWRRMLEGLRVFRMGGSWGGFESLVFPVQPEAIRGGSATAAQPYLRLHVGLEDPEDMICDLRDGFERLVASSPSPGKEDKRNER